jgi:putative DNA primase/helicase
VSESIADPVAGQESLHLESAYAADIADNGEESQPVCLDFYPPFYRPSFLHEPSNLRCSIDAADAVLAGAPSLFARGEVLVRLTVPAPDPVAAADPDAEPDAPSISEVEPVTLTEILSDLVVFQSPDPKRGSDAVVAIAPPHNAVLGLVARKRWTGIRRLTGILEAPTVRPDGSLLATPGWDMSTGYYYHPNASFLSVPESPTLDDARAAAEILFALVEDFPFVDARHRATWLGALLTRVGRAAILGPVPLHLFDANVPGAGKTKLARLIELIATGRIPADSTYPVDNEEMEKVLTATAIEGAGCLFFDNLRGGGSLGSPALSKAISSTKIKGRVLGLSLVRTLPWSTVILVTGNNIELGDDSARRTNVCRLESPYERPQERLESEFALKPDCPCGCRGEILRHARRNRPALLQAALVILRAHAVAGHPRPALTPVDFHAWSDVVRAAVAWSTGLDPCATRKDALATNKDDLERAELVRGWKQICDHHKVEGMSAGDVFYSLDVLVARVLDPHKGLRDVLCTWTKDGSLLGPGTIGAKLRAMRGRRTTYGTLEYREIKGQNRWCVVDAPAPSQEAGA